MRRKPPRIAGYSRSRVFERTTILLGLPIHENQESTDWVDTRVYKSRTSRSGAVHMRARTEQKNTRRPLNSNHKEHTLPFFSIIAFTKNEATSEPFEPKEKRCVTMMFDLARRRDRMVAVDFPLNPFHRFDRIDFRCRASAYLGPRNTSFQVGRS